MYLNTSVAVLALGFASFGACGGSQGAPSSTPPSSAEPAASADLAPPPAAAASATPPAAPTPPAPPAAGSDGPDRNMDDIRAVVAGNRDLFRACYERSLKTHPGIKGSFVLRFMVNPDGSIKSAEADQAKSEIHTDDLVACAIGVLKGLKFAPSRKGMESTVSYPFDFHPKGKP
jgi:hypothetical protein